MFTAIEDDAAPANNAPVRSVTTAVCMTRLAAERHNWAIDWRAATTVALEDTFVFVDAAPIRLAIVADASKPANAARLRAMHAAMVALATAVAAVARRWRRTRRTCGCHEAHGSKARPPRPCGATTAAVERSTRVTQQGNRQ